MVSQAHFDEVQAKLATNQSFARRNNTAHQYLLRALVYGAVAARHPEAAVVVPPRKGAVPSAAAETEPSQRNRHLRAIAEQGCLGWQKNSGYNRRALAEAAVSRHKRVIGDALRSRTDHRQATEAAIGVHVLNRMLELGRPESVRVA